MGRRGRTSFEDANTFFVTTTVVQFARVFTNDATCSRLIKNIKHYQQKYLFDILGYVIMPSHFHWIVELEPGKGTTSDIMRDIKKYSAWDVMEQLTSEKREDLLQLFSTESEGYVDQKRKFWMPRFDDQVIRSEEMLKTKIEYIHNNPVKAGLVNLPEDYTYSSARNYVLGDHSIMEVKTEWW